MCFCVVPLVVAMVFEILGGYSGAKGVKWLCVFYFLTFFIQQPLQDLNGIFTHKILPLIVVMLVQLITEAPIAASIG